MSSGTYSNIIVYIDGVLMDEESDVTITHNSGKNAVRSVVKGLSGFTLGAGSDDISISMNVPSDGWAINPSSLCHDVEALKLNPGLNPFHTLTLIAASTTYESQCFFTSAQVSHNVDSASKVTLNGTAKPAIWQ